ncbi:hypothetical protein JJB90_26045 [Vibrio alginolyticus]|nr:hypothetical protein [Vibrio alginolyticus]
MSDTTSVTFVSTMPTICGGEVNDADKANAAGNCLKVATDDADNWFTSTPSQAVMEALKYTQSNAEDNTGDTYAAINAEDDTHGPAGVIFARFRQDGDGVLNPDVGGTGDNGQLHRWCQKLSDINFGGKDYWRRPTAEELSGLYSHAGNLWENLGWPTGNRYWTSTISDVNRYNRIDLSNMDTTSSIPSNAGYGSCVASTSAPVPTPPPICDTDDDKGFCLKVATDVGGHLYSSPPSEAVMQRLGYSKRNHSDNTGRTYGQLSTKKLFHYGEGKFATFRADGEGSIGVRGHTRHYIGEYGQADRWCKDLANMGFAGRKDWHLPYVHDNLESLWENNHGNMYKSLAWPVASAYWTGELGTYSGRYGAYATSLKSARSAVYWVEEDSLFVSCRSE